MSAVISPDGKYRYLLSRRTGVGAGRCVFIMLNPSTADAETDDPTIRRCLGFAKKWNYAQLDVVNLFAYRATDPAELYKLGRLEAIGPDNYKYGAQVAAGDGIDRPILICAWGNHGGLHGQGAAAVARLKVMGHVPLALKLNVGSGEPAHPLYLKKDLKPFPI